MLRKQAGFCGVDVLAYCVMGNHFHLLVAVPEDADISDVELLRRYRLLYSEKGCPPSSASPGVLAKLLEANEAEGQMLRERILARMHDLSVFMRELKQRFGIWYNHRHGNKETIWAKRFTSVVVESSREALSTVAAYIDLNPVRAELVADPEDYAFSSYGAAVRGRGPARRGYELVFCQEVNWGTLLPSYRLILNGKGARARGARTKTVAGSAGSDWSRCRRQGANCPFRMSFVCECAISARAPRSARKDSSRIWAGSGSGVTD